MEIDARRFFSNRVVWDDRIPSKLRITNSFWDWCLRVISWIFSPSSYTSENIRTIECFKNFLVEHLGEERCYRITNRYQVNFYDKRYRGAPLLCRDIAKIITGIQDVSVDDIHEAIKKKRLSQDPRFIDIQTFEDLGREQLSELIDELKRPLQDLYHVKQSHIENLSGSVGDVSAHFFFDPFEADRERVLLSEGHGKDSFENFVHNMAARVIKRELDVGMVIPAPNHTDGSPQHYYVSGKLITGRGMVSYVLHPLGNNTSLRPIRFFRGTSLRNGEIDAMSSMINDADRAIGQDAFLSGKIYESTIREKLGPVPLEAGHSLGAAIVQYRLVDQNDMEKAYLFCGPGLPISEVHKFNAKNQKVELNIWLTSKDPYNKFGDAHLGYQAPPSVRWNLGKFYPPRTLYRDNPHITVWGKSKKYKYRYERVTTDGRRDALLYHKNKLQERVRSALGSYLSYPMRWVRDWGRHLFPTRVGPLIGLKTGTVINGRWCVENFRANPYTLSP